jgi:hypothetical protein
MSFSLNSDLEVDEMPNPEDTQRRIEGGDQADQATQVRELRQQVRRLARIIADLLASHPGQLAPTALAVDRQTIQDIQTALGPEEA